MFFIYILAVIIGFALCYLWVKLVFAIFRLIEKGLNRVNNKENANPYIAAQKIKMQNDRHYQEYLEWMDKKGSGIPFQKVLSQEEFEAEKKIKKLFS